MPSKKLLFVLVCVVAACISCSKTNTLAIFKKLSPHEAYSQKLIDAGLNHTAMGSSWLQASAASISKALTITLPYKETGYFSADKVQSSVLRFEAKRGQKLHIALSKKPEFNFNIYIDLLQQQQGNTTKTIAYADTAGLRLEYEVPKTGTYLLRLQPELLRGGNYTLTVTEGPSLDFPVALSGKPHIGSFWGDSRDEGGRRHEGVDIFAPKGTPALAAADGTVTRVTENKLGGKVVFLRPDGRDYTLYYAHLEVQLVHDGQTVRTGDTVGLIDNTGNAKNTPSHLHFGIYTFTDGAVDPLPFVNREIKIPNPVSASESMLNATARTVTSKGRIYTSPYNKAVSTSLPVNTILTVTAATGSWYKTMLPDGKEGFIKSNELALATPLHKLAIKSSRILYDSPDTAMAAHKLTLVTGDKVNVLGNYKSFYLISDASNDTGWIEAR